MEMIERLDSSELLANLISVRSYSHSLLIVIEDVRCLTGCLPEDVLSDCPIYEQVVTLHDLPPAIVTTLLKQTCT